VLLQLRSCDAVSYPVGLCQLGSRAAGETVQLSEAPAPDATVGRSPLRSSRPRS
jgi:hypothetical protein